MYDVFATGRSSSNLQNVKMITVYNQYGYISDSYTDNASETKYWIVIIVLALALILLVIVIAYFKCGSR